MPEVAARRRIAVGAALVLLLLGALPGAVRAAAAAPASTILDNGPPVNRVDIAIVGDGYTAAEMPRYRTDVGSLVQAIFQQEPFKEYQRYFNVHRIEVASSQSGSDHPERGAFVNTAFDSSYGCGGIQRLICLDDAKASAAFYGSLAPAEIDIQLVLVNDGEYGGAGGIPTVASTSPESAETVLHELGHSFGHLADEYGGGANNPSCTRNEPGEPNATAATARGAIKWGDWIDPATPLPTTTFTPGVVGLFEGARYCDTGLFRPTRSSKMNTLGRPFEPVNTEQLVLRTYDLVTPIDAVTPPASTVGYVRGGSQTFGVSSPAPLTHALATAWQLDGQPVATSSQYTLAFDALGPGAHTVRVSVSDPTPLVRTDPLGLLTDFREWTVQVPTDGGAFRPLPPTRILDTRGGPGPLGAVRPGASIDVQITGAPGVPASGVTAAVFNVTAVAPEQPGYLTVYPTGSPRPNASTLNFGVGQTVPNLAEVAVGTGGKVTLHNASPGSTHYVVDLVGWVTDSAGASGTAGRYHPLDPARLLDTRPPPLATGSTGSPLRPGADLALAVAGAGPVPATGVAAVVLNVTVTNATGGGWLTVYPGGGVAPLASSLNFVGGQTVPNRVVVALGPDGTVGFHLGGAAPSVDVVADVAGWYATGSAPAGGSLFRALGPTRIADTRSGTQVGPRGTPLGANETMAVQVAGTPGVPAPLAADAPTAAVLNVTVTATTGTGYLTIFPSGSARPLASDQNWAPGTTRANLVVAKLGPDGRISIYNSAGSTQVIVDVLGFSS